MNTKEILIAAGISEEDAAKATQALHAEYPKHFVPKTQYNNKVIELGETETQLQKAQADAGVAEEYKSKYEQTQQAYEAFKTEQEQAKELETKRSAVVQKLHAEGLNPKLTDLVLHEIDLKNIEVKDGEPSDWEKTAEPLKTKYAEFFGTTKKKGVDTPTPPEGSESKEAPKTLKDALGQYYKGDSD